MKSGVYKIVNITNGKLYVGSAVDFDGRWYRHRWMLNKREHHSSYLQNAWNKDGESNFHFEIIEGCEEEILIEREQHWLDYYQSYKKEFGYNTCSRAGNTLGYKHSEETKKKLSGENHPMFGKTGENNPNFGKHRSEETKKKNSEAHKGKHHSEQTKQKMSEAFSGEKNPRFGKHHSEQTKQKMSENHADVSGENHPRVILNWNIVHEIRRRYKEEKIIQKQLAFEYGVSRSCIQGIVQNRNWKEEIIE